MILTKKEFVEMSHIGKYTGGGRKIIAIFHDWKEGNYTEDGVEKRFVGYKYMYTFEHCTKKEAINEAYNRICLSGEMQINIWPIKMKIAENDKQRFKVPLSM